MLRSSIDIDASGALEDDFCVHRIFHSTMYSTLYDVIAI